jgi:esterase/lipase
MQQWGDTKITESPNLGKRHFSSGLNSHFKNAGLTFAEYVAFNREMLRKVRTTTNRNISDQASLAKIIEGNSPFSLLPAGENIYGNEKKYRRGILLTHGLSDSPYFMRHIAHFFQAQGFRVLAVLLPGHGTCPGDMLDVRWQEWAKTVAYGTDRLAEEVDEVYLGGYSAGAALSLYQSLKDERVRALFLFAPAFDITHMAAFASWHKLLSWFYPRLQWLDLKPDQDAYKYESFAKNTATQMYRLTLALKKKLAHHQVSIPIFAVASEDDKTVKISATIELMGKQTNPANKLILYTADTVKLSQTPIQGNIEWVNSMLPEQKILSSAHTAILIAPDDEHYGVGGNYANCIHYYPDEMDKYLACLKHPDDCWLGEVNEKNLKAGMLRRLMYNPNFSALKLSMQQFIERLP